MQRRPRIVAPLILILAGVLFLFNNFGLLPWGMWGALWRFWPLILVLLGLEIIVGRAPAWVSVLAVILTLLAVGGLVAYGLAVRGGLRGRALVSEELYQPLEDLTSAQVKLTLGVGNVTLNALADSPALLAGEVQYPAGSPIHQSFDTKGGQGLLHLEAEGGAEWFPAWLGRQEVRWDLGLTPRIPLELEVEAGVGETELDLRELRVERFLLDTGVGEVSVTFPAEVEETRARVEAGVGSITLVIPEGVAARISVDTGIGAVHVDQRRFPRSGDFYLSSRFEEAQHRLRLTIDGGIGKITVQ